MTEGFLQDVQSCVERYVRAAEKEASDRDERLLKEIHRLCCLIADKENGTGIAPLRAIARNFANLHEEAKGRNDIAAALYEFGSGFALLRASAFQETIPQFEKFPECQGDVLGTIELAAACFGCVAASLGGELERARAGLSRAKRLAERITGTSTCYQGLVAMAESSILYKAGEHHQTGREPAQCLLLGQRTVELELPVLSRTSASHRSQGIARRGPIPTASTCFITNENCGRSSMTFWGRSGVSSRKRASANFVASLKARKLVWALPATSLPERICTSIARASLTQRGDIHCSNRELEKAEVNYKLAQETADASGQLWLKAHVGNSIARLRLLQGRPAEARRILESFEPVWKETKNYGKYLYLLGRADAALGNYGDAEQTYRSALRSLKTHGLSSTEALTRDRLAQLLMKVGRKEGRASNGPAH